VKKLDRVTKEMFELILTKLDKIDGRFDTLEGRSDGFDSRFDKLEGRFDGLEGRFDGLENEVKEFRAEMKDQIKGLDGKMDLIYHKLKSDIAGQSSDPNPKYKVIKEE
jgi:predicted nuclease with TOPRIM domain